MLKYFKVMEAQIWIWWIADAPTCALSAASWAEIWRIWGCREDQESNHLKIKHKCRPTTAWLKVLSSFSLSSYLCSLFPQYSVKPTSWSLTQVLKVQAMLTFYDAIKAISPFKKNFSGHRVRLAFIFHNQLQWEGLTISPDSALDMGRWERGHGLQEWASCINPKMST